MGSNRWLAQETERLISLTLEGEVGRNTAIVDCVVNGLDPSRNSSEITLGPCDGHDPRRATTTVQTLGSPWQFLVLKKVDELSYGIILGTLRFSRPRLDETAEGDRAMLFSGVQWSKIVGTFPSALFISCGLGTMLHKRVLP